MIGGRSACQPMSVFASALSYESSTLPTKFGGPGQPHQLTFADRVSARLTPDIPHAMLAFDTELIPRDGDFTG